MARSSTIVPARSRPKESKAWQVNRCKHCVADPGYFLQEKGYMKEKTWKNNVQQSLWSSSGWLQLTRQIVSPWNERPSSSASPLPIKTVLGQKKVSNDLNEKIRDQCCAPEPSFSKSPFSSFRASRHLCKSRWSSTVSVEWTCSRLAMRKSCNCISAPVENGSECLTCLAKGLKQDKESHMKRLAKVKLESSWHKRVWVDPWKHLSFLSTPNKQAMPVHGHAFFMPTFIVQHSTKCRVKIPLLSPARQKIALNLRGPIEHLQKINFTRHGIHKMDQNGPSANIHKSIDPTEIYAPWHSQPKRSLYACPWWALAELWPRLGAQKLICEDLGCWDTSMSSERFLAFDKRGLGKDVHQLSTPL